MQAGNNWRECNDYATILNEILGRCGAPATLSCSRLAVTVSPTPAPTLSPTVSPTTSDPTTSPSFSPTAAPTTTPTTSPTESPAPEQTITMYFDLVSPITPAGPPPPTTGQGSSVSEALQTVIEETFVFLDSSETNAARYVHSITVYHEMGSTEYVVSIRFKETTSTTVRAVGQVLSTYCSGSLADSSSVNGCNLDAGADGNLPVLQVPGRNSLLRATSVTVSGTAPTRAPSAAPTSTLPTSAPSGGQTVRIGFEIFDQDLFDELVADGSVNIDVQSWMITQLAQMSPMLVSGSIRIEFLENGARENHTFATVTPTRADLSPSSLMAQLTTAIQWGFADTAFEGVLRLTNTYGVESLGGGERLYRRAEDDNSSSTGASSSGSSGSSSDGSGGNSSSSGSDSASTSGGGTISNSGGSFGSVGSDSASTSGGGTVSNSGSNSGSFSNSDGSSGSESGGGGSGGGSSCNSGGTSGGSSSVGSGSAGSSSGSGAVSFSDGAGGSGGADGTSLSTGGGTDSGGGAGGTSFGTEGSTSGGDGSFGTAGGADAGGTGSTSTSFGAAGGTDSGGGADGTSFGTEGSTSGGTGGTSFGTTGGTDSGGSGATSTSFGTAGGTDSGGGAASNSFGTAGGTDSGGGSTSSGDGGGGGDTSGCGTSSPSITPTVSPTTSPTTSAPTVSPTMAPTSSEPTQFPTRAPTQIPTTSNPTQSPTSSDPTASPTTSPTASPTKFLVENAIHLNGGNNEQCRRSGPAPAVLLQLNDLLDQVSELEAARNITEFGSLMCDHSGFAAVVSFNNCRGTAALLNMLIDKYHHDGAFNPTSSDSRSCGFTTATSTATTSATTSGSTTAVTSLATTASTTATSTVSTTAVSTVSSSATTSVSSTAISTASTTAATTVTTTATTTVTSTVTTQPGSASYRCRPMSTAFSHLEGGPTAQACTRHATYLNELLGWCSLDAPELPGGTLSPPAPAGNLSCSAQNRTFYAPTGQCERHALMLTHIIQRSYSLTVQATCVRGHLAVPLDGCTEFGDGVNDIIDQLQSNPSGEPVAGCSSAQLYADTTTAPLVFDTTSTYTFRFSDDEQYNGFWEVGFNPESVINALERDLVNVTGIPSDRLQVVAFALDGLVSVDILERERDSDATSDVLLNQLDDVITTGYTFQYASRRLSAEHNEAAVAAPEESTGESASVTTGAVISILLVIVILVAVAVYVYKRQKAEKLAKALVGPVDGVQMVSFDGKPHWLDEFGERTGDTPGVAETNLGLSRTTSEYLTPFGSKAVVNPAMASPGGVEFNADPRSGFDYVIRNTRPSMPFSTATAFPVVQLMLRDEQTQRREYAEVASLSGGYKKNPLNFKYIDDYNKVQGIIASKGDLPWAVAWESRCSVILLLPSMSEKGGKILPEEGQTTQHGSILVRSNGRTNIPGKVVRTVITLADQSTGGQRIVQAFQLSGWSSSTMVQDFGSLLMAGHEAREIGTSVMMHDTESKSRPSTGSAALSWLCINSALDTGYVDLARTLLLVRAQDRDLLRDQGEYTFVHSALMQMLITIPSMDERLQTASQRQIANALLQWRNSLNAESGGYIQLSGDAPPSPTTQTFGAAAAAPMVAPSPSAASPAVAYAMPQTVTPAAYASPQAFASAPFAAPAPRVGPHQLASSERVASGAEPWWEAGTFGVGLTVKKLDGPAAVLGAETANTTLWHKSVAGPGMLEPHDGIAVRMRLVYDRPTDQGDFYIGISAGGKALQLSFDTQRLFEEQEIEKIVEPESVEAAADPVVDENYGNAWGVKRRKSVELLAPANVVKETVTVPVERTARMVLSSINSWTPTTFGEFEELDAKDIAGKDPQSVFVTWVWPAKGGPGGLKVDDIASSSSVTFALPSIIREKFAAGITVWIGGGEPTAEYAFQSFAVDAMADYAPKPVAAAAAAAAAAAGSTSADPVASPQLGPDKHVTDAFIKKQGEFKLTNDLRKAAPVDTPNKQIQLIGGGAYAPSPSQPQERSNAIYDDHQSVTAAVTPQDRAVPANPSTWMTQLTREAAMQGVLDQPNGTFVVRPSSKATSGYVLTYTANTTTTHARLMLEGNGVAMLGSNESFSTIEQLIAEAQARIVPPLPYTLVPIGGAAPAAAATAAANTAAATASDAPAWSVELDRTGAVERLAGAPDGSFVVRPSPKASSGLIITFLFGGDVLHYKISRHKTGFAVAKSTEIFATVEQLISSAMQRPVEPLPCVLLMTPGSPYAARSSSLAAAAGPQLVQVTLVKREGMKLGLGITSTPNGNFVSRVTETGLAHEQAPEIQVGLKFEVVNGQSCTGLDKGGVVTLLKSEGMSQVQIILSDPNAPPLAPAAPEQVIYDLASSGQSAEQAPPPPPPRSARAAPDPNAFFKAMAPSARPPAVAERSAAVASAVPDTRPAIVPQVYETAVPAQVAAAAPTAMSFKSKWQQDLAARKAAFK